MKKEAMITRTFTKFLCHLATVGEDGKVSEPVNIPPIYKRTALLSQSELNKLSEEEGNPVFVLRVEEVEERRGMTLSDFMEHSIVL